MLENLMSALKEGKALLDRLREIANEGSLDSRPDRIKADADSGMEILQIPITYLNYIKNYLRYQAA